MFRTKVIISILEEVLGLLQPLHPVLELQIDLWLTKMVPYDSTCQKIKETTFWTSIVWP